MSTARTVVSLILLVVGFAVPVWEIYLLTSGFTSNITITSATTQGQFAVVNPTTTVSAPIVLPATVATPQSIMAILSIGTFLFAIGIILLLLPKRT